MSRRYKRRGVSLEARCPHCDGPVQSWRRRWLPLDPWWLYECGDCRSVLAFVDWHPDAWRVMSGESEGG